MAVIEVDNLDDPRLWPYRNLKDRELARQGDRFIAEGRHVALRLLSSSYAVESVLCGHKRVEAMSAHVPADVPMYVAPDAVVDAVVGYRFHSGVLAVGVRPPPMPLATWFRPWRDRPRLTLVVCPHTRNCDNLGSIIRNAAALGADGILLGEECTDPFWRRTIRVSMGTIFHLPLRVSSDLAADLAALRADYGLTLVATVLDADATPLPSARRPLRLALMLGSEDQGLGDRWERLADQRLTLPMHHGTDSLNVAVAAAVFLYHFGQPDRPANSATGSGRAPSHEGLDRLVLG